MFEDGRMLIKSDQVRKAFDELLRLLSKIDGYELVKIEQGNLRFPIRLRKIADGLKKTGRDSFGITVAQKNLRFYFRQPRNMNPPLTLADVAGFPDQTEQKKGEISVRIMTVQHARDAVRLAFPELHLESTNPDEYDEAEAAEYWEGALKSVRVNAYERNGAAREACIRRWGHRCAACDFDFETTYGERGRSFIHVHHLKPISEIREEYQLNPEEDLRPVCPNCHAMLHRFSPVMSIEDLEKLLATQKRRNEAN